MSSSLLINNVLDRLRSDPNLSVHDGAVSGEPAKPYVVVYTASQSRDADDLDLSGHEYMIRFTVHCIGEDAYSARFAADKVDSLLFKYTPDVPGYVLWPMSMDVPPVSYRDETTGYLTIDQVTVYALKAHLTE